MSELREFIKVIESNFPDDRLTYQKAIATLHPESAGEASQLFKLANEHKQELYITGFGNNIDPIDRPFTEMVSVRTDRLNDIIEIAEHELYVKAGSGFPLREINKYLEKHDLFLPHAQLPYVGSVGGAVAVNLAAELNGHDLPIKKYLIQAEIVTPEGDIINPGSVCFKSVSGYDVVKIFASSWGLLGLVVSATFRVIPISGREEFDGMKQKEIDRGHFLSGLDESSSDADAVYSRKIKSKFDPNNILPIV